jgi:hypothetical protein
MIGGALAGDGHVAFLVPGQRTKRSAPEATGSLRFFFYFGFRVFK